MNADTRTVSQNWRAQVLPRLQALLPGKNLYELAREYGVTIHKDGKLNKGWAGQTLERIAQLDAGNAQRRDGIDFELKSTSLVPGREGWQPKETIKITQMNPSAVLEETFETSALWNKLASLLMVGLHHESESVCTVVRVNAFDFSEPLVIDAIRGEWQEVRLTLSLGEIAEATSLGTSGHYIQLRPTGDRRTNSTCPITGQRFQAQAFYGTKRLVKRVLGLSN